MWEFPASALGLLDGEPSVSNRFDVEIDAFCRNCQLFLFFAVAHEARPAHIVLAYKIAWPSFGDVADDRLEGFPSNFISLERNYSMVEAPFPLCFDSYLR